MSFDLFTLDVKTACPTEYAAWEAARADWHALWMRFVDGEPGLVEAIVLEAKRREQDAEACARAAYARARP